MPASRREKSSETVSGHGKADVLQLLFAGEDLARLSVHDDKAVVHHDHAVGVLGFVHVVGDEHNGDALVAG